VRGNTQPGIIISAEIINMLLMERNIRAYMPVWKSTARFRSDRPDCMTEVYSSGVEVRGQNKQKHGNLEKKSQTLAPFTEEHASSYIVTEQGNVNGHVWMLEGAGS